MAAVLGAALVGGYLLFASVDKWGYYNARYMIPLLVAWAALIGIALSRFSRWVGWLVVAGLVLACLPQLINSESRPLEVPTSHDVVLSRALFRRLLLRSRANGPGVRGDHC